MKLKFDLKFLESKKVFRKGGETPSPNLYWKGLLVFSFIVMLASFIFGFFLYKQTVADFKLDQENFLPRNEKIKKERLDKLLEYFSQRENKSKNIILFPSTISDPSI